MSDGDDTVWAAVFAMVAVYSVVRATGCSWLVAVLVIISVVVCVVLYAMFGWRIADSVSLWRADRADQEPEPPRTVSLLDDYREPVDLETVTSPEPVNLDKSPDKE